MAEILEVKNIGLRGVKVADTRISDVDGEKGMLIYRGFNVIELAQFSTFEEVSFLLLNDHLPTREELKDFQSELISEREVPEAQPQPELYRPDADYIGNYCGLQGCEYIPIEERSS
jgi:citrate synthase